MEDTFNLLGDALRKALGVICCQQGRGLAEVAEEAGAEALAGSSLKAALDWDDPSERSSGYSGLSKPSKSTCKAVVFSSRRRWPPPSRRRGA